MFRGTIEGLYVRHRPDGTIVVRVGWSRCGFIVNEDLKDRFIALHSRYVTAMTLLVPVGVSGTIGTTGMPLVVWALGLLLILGLLSVASTVHGRSLLSAQTRVLLSAEETLDRRTFFERLADSSTLSLRLSYFVFVGLGAFSACLLIIAFFTKGADLEFGPIVTGIGLVSFSIAMAYMHQRALRLQGERRGEGSRVDSK